MSKDGENSDMTQGPLAQAESRRSGATTPPGEGERRSQRGYERQYHCAGAAIYAALDRNNLLWVGVADRTAGIADDVVLGFPGLVIGHQFKTSLYPGKFTVRTFLLGAAGLFKPLVEAWQSLQKANPGDTVQIHLVTNDYPSNTDQVGTGPADHSAAFLAEFDSHPIRSLADWRQSRWQPFIDELYQTSGLDESAFEHFLANFRLIQGRESDFVQLHRLSTEGARLASKISALLPRLVADPRDKDRWSRAELLEVLGWRDSTVSRHNHLFPVGAHVQRNVETEEALRRAVRNVTQGYIALVAPPGAGKSTLLQTSLATETGVVVCRYLAYVPGVGQGIGRAEADDFLEDLSTQLKNSGLSGVRFCNDTLPERREQFGVLLHQGGARYQNNQVRTIIVVDGLDHIPREERPQRSLLAELPLPDSIPAGVVFVLGTQTLELRDLRPAVRDQGSSAGRLITVSPLKRPAVYCMADLFGLDADISRERIFEISLGHPLVTRYVIEAFAPATTRNARQSCQARCHSKVTSRPCMNRRGGGLRTMTKHAVYSPTWRAQKDPYRSNSLLERYRSRPSNVH